MSSYYGIVFPEFWTGDTGRALQEIGGKDAQILALYQMSCRYATMIGLYSLTVRDVRHETGLGMKAFVRGCAALAAAGFSEYDAGTEHVWVREMAKFRLGLQKRSPLDPDDKRVTGVQNLYDKLADNPFLSPFFDRYAKEVRLKKKRTSGRGVVAPQDGPPSKGLTRGLQGPWKPVNSTADSSTADIREQGTGKSTGAARRPVEISAATRSHPDHDAGTFELYEKIAHESREQSLRDDHTDSISNIAEIFKTLCSQRKIAYDSDIAARAIESAINAKERRRA